MRRRPGSTAVRLRRRCATSLAWRLPPSTAAFIHETLARVGMIRLVATDDGLSLVSGDAALLDSLCERATSLRGRHLPGRGWQRRSSPIPPEQRGQVKLAFAALGYPIADDAPRRRGRADAATRSDRTRRRSAPISGNRSPRLRGRGRAGSFSCRAARGRRSSASRRRRRLQARTLVLCPGRTNAAQWERAFRAWTDLPPEAIGIYDGARRALFPVTIATYQALTVAGARGGCAAPSRRIHGGGLGAGHLRRGAYAARRRLPALRECGDAGASPSRPDGDAHSRGWPGDGRLRPDRAGALQSPVARTGGAGLDRARHVRGGARAARHRLARRRRRSSMRVPPP